MDYEIQYLETYFKAKDSFLFAVFDGAEMVGATTGIPLAAETPEVQAPFLKTGINIDRVFYFGESVLLPAYRGLGLGHRFFDKREAFAHHLGGFDLTCFCAVVREEAHPKKPEGYRPLDEFWSKRGYCKNPELRSTFDWPDIGEAASTPKEMVYWSKVWK